jgi:GT2 family glycosyltransferase
MATSPSIRFSVDEPAEAQEFASGDVLIRGWAIANCHLSIAAKVGETAWVGISHGKSRADVAVAYPAEPNALHSGFSGRLNVSGFLPGQYEFVLQIRSSPDEVSEVRRTIKILDSAELKREAVLSIPGDILRIKLEEPFDNSLILHGSVLRVTGWAVAKSGVERLDIWLDNEGPYTSHYGLMREDIGSLYDDFPKASHAGFLWAWPTGHLSPGIHTLRIVCKSKADNSVQITSLFQIDPKSEYEHWAALNSLDSNQLLNLFEEANDFSNLPKISIVTPVFRTPEGFLRKCVDSVKKQVYPNWELILVDDCSGNPRLSSLLQAFVNEDRRIRKIALDSNTGIAGATNAGIALCSGEYVALLDHDDELSPDALFQVVQALGQDPSIDVLYSDEDKIDQQGAHKEGFFKPDWSPDLLLSMNYVCHFLVCRRSLLQEVDGLRLGFDGSQDYDLILRLSERTSKIHRIAKVLYHWRIHEHSTAANTAQKPAASDAGRHALEQHLLRTGVQAKVLENGTCHYRVKYDIVGQPEVAIIIPTGGSHTLEAAIESILAVTSYPNYRIVIVDNSSGENVLRTISRFQRHHPIGAIDLRGTPFNFSLLCNSAARRTTAEYLLFLNDDTTIITPAWIESMLEHAQRPHVGAVGALLLFPNGTIQHAGVVTGLLGTAGHSFRGLPDQPLYFAFPHVVRNCSAVTGACLMTRREVFDAVSGFDETNLPTCFQDVDLCLRMLEKDYRIVYTPFAKLFHYESVSKKVVTGLSEFQYMQQRWRPYLTEDPYYNPNLTKGVEDYSLRYDHLFLQTDTKELVSAPAPYTNGALTGSTGVQTSAAKKRRRLGQIEFYAQPDAVKSSDKQTNPPTVFWSASGADKVQVRVGSPIGPLLAEGGPAGSAFTGSWIQSGTVFYLVDATETSMGSPDKVLSVLQV